MNLQYGKYILLHFQKIILISWNSSSYKLDLIIMDELQIIFVLISRKFILVMSQDRKMYKCTCADCGKDSEVPFEPKPDRPVYCKECLEKHQK